MVEGNELSSSRYMHARFNCLSDYAESLKLMTFVVFLFWVIEQRKSALPEEMDNIGLCAVIHE